MLWVEKKVLPCCKLSNQYAFDGTAYVFRTVVWKILHRILHDNKPVRHDLVRRNSRCSFGLGLQIRQEQRCFKPQQLVVHLLLFGRHTSVCGCWSHWDRWNRRGRFKIVLRYLCWTSSHVIHCFHFSQLEFGTIHHLKNEVTRDHPVNNGFNQPRTGAK